MTTPNLYRRAMDGFGRRVDAVRGDQWSDPVPCCPEWDVHGLVAHVIEEALWTPRLLADESTDGESIEDELSSDDLRPVWERAARRAVDAVEEPGALERRVQLSSGEASGQSYVSEMFADTLIHSWDLASAIGGDTTLDADLVDACAEWFDEKEHEWRSGGAVGAPAPVPANADAQTALLARFGRRSEDARR